MSKKALRKHDEKVATGAKTEAAPALRLLLDQLADGVLIEMRLDRLIRNRALDSRIEGLWPR